MQKKILTKKLILSFFGQKQFGGICWKALGVAICTFFISQIFDQNH
jgi:hypothetical protein